MSFVPLFIRPSGTALLSLTKVCSADHFRRNEFCFWDACAPQGCCKYSDKFALRKHASSPSRFKNLRRHATPHFESASSRKLMAEPLISGLRSNRWRRLRRRRDYPPSLQVEPKRRDAFAAERQFLLHQGLTLRRHARPCRKASNSTARYPQT